MNRNFIKYSDEVKKMIEEKTMEYIEKYVAKQILGLIEESKSVSFELNTSTNSFEYKPKYDEYWIARSNRFFYEDSMKEYKRRSTK